MRTLLVGLAFVLSACGGTPAGQPGALVSESPAATPTATGDCVTLAALPAGPAPPLEVIKLRDGTQRVTSADGGYSIVVPGDWLVSPSPFGTHPSFGQAHMSSFDPRFAPTPAPEAGHIRPPEAGIQFDIEVWDDPFGESPEAFARRVRIGPDQVEIVPGAALTLDGYAAYRAAIKDERRFQPSEGDLIVTRQTRAVWVVATARKDRMLVLYATPAENSLLPVVERAIQSLEVTAPVEGSVPVTLQRSEIFQQWLIGKAGPIPGRRVEAKLMSRLEAESALDPTQPSRTINGILRLDSHPDELLWVVAVSGPDLPEPRGGPIGAQGSPRPTRWMIYTTAATDDPRRGAGTGMTLSPIGDWPPHFGALPDRCH